MFHVELAPLAGIFGPLKLDLGVFWHFRGTDFIMGKNKNANFSKSPHGPIFKFCVVIREVILQKMAPILDPVNFFSVLTLLADCDRASILSVKVFHFHLVMDKETLIATSLSRLKYGSVAPTLSLLLCPIKCTDADTKHSKVFGCMHFPFKIGMFLVFCKSTSRAAS